MLSENKMAELSTVGQEVTSQCTGNTSCCAGDAGNTSCNPAAASGGSGRDEELAKAEVAILATILALALIGKSPYQPP